MTASRKEYFADLIDDCLQAATDAGIPFEDQPQVVASLIVCDSLNGLRKAVLTTLSPGAGLRK